MLFKAFINLSVVHAARMNDDGRGVAGLYRCGWVHVFILLWSCWVPLAILACTQLQNLVSCCTFESDRGSGATRTRGTRRRVASRAARVGACVSPHAWPVQEHQHVPHVEGDRPPVEVVSGIPGDTFHRQVLPSACVGL